MTFIPDPIDTPTSLRKRDWGFILLFLLISILWILSIIAIITVFVIFILFIRQKEMREIDWRRFARKMKISLVIWASITITFGLLMGLT